MLLVQDLTTTTTNRGGDPEISGDMSMQVSLNRYAGGDEVHIRVLENIQTAKELEIGST